MQDYKYSVRAIFSIYLTSSSFETPKMLVISTFPLVRTTHIFHVSYSVKLHKIVQFKDPREFRKISRIQRLEISVTPRDPRQINFSKPEGLPGRVIPEEGLAQDYRKIGRVGSIGSPPNIAVIPATLRYRMLRVCMFVLLCVMCVCVRVGAYKFIYVCAYM